MRIRSQYRPLSTVRRWSIIPCIPFHSVPGPRREQARPYLDRPVASSWASSRISELEHRAASLLRPFSLPLLRFSLGLVLIWFGSLKVANLTPVRALVAGTVPWVDAAWFVPALGAFEVLIGFALIAGRRLTVVSVVLVAHLTGTFLVLVMQPQVAFQHGNPLLLTTEGEFVLKNLVLISAALVIASRRPARPVERSEVEQSNEVGQAEFDLAS